MGVAAINRPKLPRGANSEAMQIHPMESKAGLISGITPGADEAVDTSEHSIMTLLDDLDSGAIKTITIGSQEIPWVVYYPINIQGIDEVTIAASDTKYMLV